MTLPTSYALSGNDAHLLQGLYCDTFTFFQEKIDNIYFDCTKTWVPSTGRYYIIPILPIHSDPEKVLPESKILNDFSYFFSLLFINHIKENLCLAGRRTQNEKTLYADLILAGITQLITVLLSDKINHHEYIRSLKPIIA